MAIVVGEGEDRCVDPVMFLHRPRTTVGAVNLSSPQPEQIEKTGNLGAAGAFAEEQSFAGPVSMPQDRAVRRTWRKQVYEVLLESGGANQTHFLHGHRVDGMAASVRHLLEARYSTHGVRQQTVSRTRSVDEERIVVD